MKSYTFEGRVLRVVMEIPRGRVSTYKIVAQKLNSKAYRAVGNALNKNKTPILIPCHRVVKSDGEIGGYSRGIKEKIKLLREEGVEVKNNKINLKKYLYHF